MSYTVSNLNVQWSVHSIRVKCREKLAKLPVAPFRLCVSHYTPGDIRTFNRNRSSRRDMLNAMLHAVGDAFNGNLLKHPRKCRARMSWAPFIVDRCSSSWEPETRSMPAVAAKPRRGRGFCAMVPPSYAICISTRHGRTGSSADSIVL